MVGLPCHLSDCSPSKLPGNISDVPSGPHTMEVKECKEKSSLRNAMHLTDTETSAKYRSEKVRMTGSVTQLTASVPAHLTHKHVPSSSIHTLGQFDRGEKRIGYVLRSSEMRTRAGKCHGEANLISWRGSLSNKVPHKTTRHLGGSCTLRQKLEKSVSGM